MLDTFRNHCQSLQRAVDRDYNASHKADAEKYRWLLVEMEEEHRVNTIALTMAHDELEELKSKLREYDSAARDLANITQLRAHIDDLKGKLVRSQELVASYQVCTRF